MPKKRKDRAAPGPRGPDHFLQTVPKANEAMIIHRRRDTALVEIPVQKAWYMVPPITWVLPLSKTRSVELDRLGTTVLALCDGRSNVEKIIEIFAADHKLSFREAQLPVTQFLRQLTRRGIVVLIGLKEDASEQ